MIPAGYMFKLAGKPPSHLTAKNVMDIFSVGACGGSNSPFFAEYISYWKHNGYWFFDSPAIMEEIAETDGISLASMTLFYYEFYEFEFDKDDYPGHVDGWSKFQRDAAFPTDVQIPKAKILAGYDVTEYVCRNSPECSLLSCSNLAVKFTVNSHCLFDTFEEAKASIETGAFHAIEPGPYRLVAVYLVP
jgi:hypothetical protein